MLDDSLRKLLEFENNKQIVSFANVLSNIWFESQDGVEKIVPNIGQYGYQELLNFLKEKTKNVF